MRMTFLEGTFAVHQYKLLDIVKVFEKVASNTECFYYASCYKFHEMPILNFVSCAL